MSNPVEALIVEMRKRLDTAHLAGKQLSRLCSTSEHSWCVNRTEQESHCDCPCHAAKHIRLTRDEAESVLSALASLRSSPEVETLIAEIERAKQALWSAVGAEVGDPNYDDVSVGYLAERAVSALASLRGAAGQTYHGYSPRRLYEAGIAVSRDFHVRDVVTNESRVMTDTEWDAEMAGSSWEAGRGAAEPEQPHPEARSSPEREQRMLTFEHFSAVNRERCESPNGFNHHLGSWSTSDWFTALLGELGEAANNAKKLNRYRDGIPGNKEALQELKAKLRRELGDTFVYLDLLCQSLGFNIGDAAVEVFNAKSAEIGCSITVVPDPDLATLRAQVQALTEERDEARMFADSRLATRKVDVAVIERLTEERDTWQRRAVTTEDLRADAVLARADAAEARLREVEAEREVSCPACGVPVKQVSSATLSLALWQHWNWSCSYAKRLTTLATVVREVEQACDAAMRLNVPAAELVGRIRAALPKEGQP
jgi:NTP pyrophosphatase (non-canonical NTP hydrolase)